MLRQFAIPYNNSEPISYLSGIEKYNASIDSVYFGLQQIVASHLENPVKTIRDQLLLQQYTTEFLKLSKGKYKRVLAVNTAFFPKNDCDRGLFVYNTLLPIIDSFGIEAVIISDFSLARTVHDVMPELEIQTSCNSYHFLIKTMEYWHNEVGTAIFNPPREILRMPKLLDEVKSTGYKLKCLVNEPCLFGCPHQINHACYLAAKIQPIEPYCLREDKDLTDILKSNFICPRHLKLFDDKVDIYKIASRGLPTNKLLKVIDCYVNERNDVDIKEFLAHCSLGRYKDISIPAKIVPDKLLSCECKECDTCQICDKIIQKCIASAK